MLVYDSLRHLKDLKKLAISVDPNCDCAKFRNFHEIIPNVNDLSITTIDKYGHYFELESDDFYESLIQLDKMEKLKILRLENLQKPLENILSIISERSFNLRELHLNNCEFRPKTESVLIYLRNAKELTRLNFKWRNRSTPECDADNDIFYAEVLDIIKTRTSRLPFYINGWLTNGERIVHSEWLKIF